MGSSHDRLQLTIENEMCYENDSPANIQVSLHRWFAPNDTKGASVTSQSVEAPELIEAGIDSPIIRLDYESRYERLGSLLIKGRVAHCRPDLSACSSVG